MKWLICNSLFILILLVTGCNPDPKLQEEVGNRERVLIAAKEIIQSGTCALITLDENKLPQARTMDPFPPESNFTIWVATNPKSRKVKQIRNNPNVTLYYTDKNENGYVSIYGIAELVDDQKEKDKRWKEEWKDFYPNRTEGYILIKVVPDRLEVINYARGITGNSETWQPAVIYFSQ